MSPIVCSFRLGFFLIACTLLVSTVSISAQSLDGYQDLRYRLIGPFRASRTVGAVGIPSQPNVFFIGINNGGVWKTTDYAQGWEWIASGRITDSSLG